MHPLPSTVNSAKAKNQATFVASVLRSRRAPSRKGHKGSYSTRATDWSRSSATAFEVTTRPSLSWRLNGFGGFLQATHTAERTRNIRERALSPAQGWERVMETEAGSRQGCRPSCAHRDAQPGAWHPAPEGSHGAEEGAGTAGSGARKPR